MSLYWVTYKLTPVVFLAGIEGLGFYFFSRIFDQAFKWEQPLIDGGLYFRKNH